MNASKTKEQIIEPITIRTIKYHAIILSFLANVHKKHGIFKLYASLATMKQKKELSDLSNNSFITLFLED